MNDQNESTNPAIDANACESQMDRREFLATSAAAAAVGAGVLSASAEGAQPKPPIDNSDLKTMLPEVTLGRTGRVLPRLGIGCSPLAKIPDEQEAVDVLLRAFDLGVRYIDTARSYTGGRSEYLVGLALAQTSIDRSEFFVATKTRLRTADGAWGNLMTSLETMQLDYIDSQQIHYIKQDVVEIFGEDGALAACEEARDQGLIHHIGVTTHADNTLYMEYALENYQWDTILVPVNPIRLEYSGADGTARVFELAQQQDAGIVAMKQYQSGHLITLGGYKPEQLVQYALDMPGVHVIEPGFDAIDQVEDIARYVASQVSPD